MCRRPRPRSAGRKRDAGGADTSSRLLLRSRVLTTDTGLMLGLAPVGATIAIPFEVQARGDDDARGGLVPVLEEFATPFPRR